jgi:hypothetical protein
VYGRVFGAGALTATVLATVGLASHPGRSVPSSAPTGEQEELAANDCGIERWAVKTLTDAGAHSVVFRPRPSTVDALRGLPNPGAGFATPRIRGPETTTYRIAVRLLYMKRELDRDVHLVVASPRTGRTMIVELPSSTCTRGAVARYAMARARASLVKACGPPTGSWRRIAGGATITGVGFFDVLHGQRGVAPNGIELHPVVAFGVTRCR